MLGALHAKMAWLRIHQLAAAEVDYRIRQILPEYWGASTPCAEWDVYEVVAHCVVENIRVPLILDGASFEQVMSVDKEVVFEDPEMAWEVSWRNAVAAFSEADLEGTVVTAALGWAQGRRDQMAKMPELFAPPITSAAEADEQTELLEIFGREV